MEKPRELYHEEVENLNNFKEKLTSHAIYREDLEHFCGQYEELVAQAKVITRVSDRLQKKLDNANIQIREQNEEITDKNIQLGQTISQLVQARVGRRASTIMLTVALLLFILEQYFLQPVIEEMVTIPYLDLAILGLLFFIVKFLESGLESYFMNREKRKIVEKENASAELKTAPA